MLFSEYVDFLKDCQNPLSAWRVEDSKNPLTTSITVEIDTENCSPNEKAAIKEEVKKMLNKKYDIRDTYPKPRKVIYDETAGVTVVLWMDGTKTIVRAEEGAEHDAYHGYCAALAKKIHGTNSALQRELKKVLEVHNKKEKEDKTEICNTIFDDGMKPAEQTKTTNVLKRKCEYRNNKFWSKLE